MDAKELLKKVRRIEIKTRGLSQNIFAGEYHSAFKGRGMMFSEVREYQYGDDIRDIDWNVTARHNKPYVKVFEEERELTVMLLVDVSGSRLFGAVGEEKREMIAEIAATLAFSAIQNNDKIGVIFFSDKIEKFIPPKKGRKHILFIIRELLDFTPESRGTDIGMVLRYFSDALKKRCTTFLISDFIDEKDYYKALSIASNKHDVYGVQVYDKRDAQLPDVGLMRVADLETGTEQWVDTSSKRVRNDYSRWWYERQQNMSDTLKRCRVGSVSVATDEDFVSALKGLFQKHA
jgi:von willebrand factor, type A